MQSRTQLQREMGVTWELSGHDAWRALQRTGATDKQTASWGLRWVQRVSSRLNEEEWTSLRQEIGGLASIRVGDPTQLARHVRAALALEDHAVYGLPTKEEAVRCLALIKASVLDLLRCPSATVGPLRVMVTVSRQDRREKSEVSEEIPNKVDQVIYRFLKALQNCGGLVNKCPRCSKIFLAGRANQVYCTQRCQSVVTSRNYRKEQKEKKEKRRNKARLKRRRESGRAK